MNQISHSLNYDSESLIEGEAWYIVATCILQISQVELGGVSSDAFCEGGKLLIGLTYTCSVHLFNV